MAHIINNPHGLYYNGELIGIITNPDPHGDYDSICGDLSPDEGLADIRPLHPSAVEALTEVLQNLPETIPTNDED